MRRDREWCFKRDEIQENKTSVMMDECLNIDWQEEEKYKKLDKKRKRKEDQGDEQLIVYKLYCEWKHGSRDARIIR